MAPVDENKLDPALVAALYVQHGDELRYFLQGVLRHPELAQEAMQVAFAKCIEQGHTVQEGSLKAWLFRVAFHEAINLRRRQQAGERALAAFSRQPTNETPQADARLIRYETVEQVKAALSQLPAEQRRVVEMRIYENKTFAVIAAELKCPLGTVLSRMQLALRKLRLKLESTHES